MSAQDIGQGVCRLMINLGYAPLSEVTLKNNRRADLMGFAENGTILIVEIKSSVADFRSDHKWQEYLGYADYYYFAVDQEFPADILPSEEGLMIADNYGGDIIRAAQKRPVAPARRRSLLLRFARMAAMRLHQANNPRDYRVS